LPQSASCSENFVIPPDVFGQTLRGYVRFTPKSGQTGEVSTCPLCAKSGHNAVHKKHCYSMTSSARVLVCRFSISTSLEAKLKDQGDEAAN